MEAHELPSDPLVVFRDALADLAASASDERRRQVLAVEVQLLQKSEGRRRKDEADFATALPTPGPEARRWLHDALELVTPGHTWAAAPR